MDRAAKRRGARGRLNNLTSPTRRRRISGRLAALLLALACLAGCQQIREGLGGGARPRTLADVPAVRLAFRFEPDADASRLPSSYTNEETETPLDTIKADFDARRGEEALLRTVVSPNGQVALALYATAETAEGDFRMDLYSAQGQFLRNVLPPELVGTFPQWVSWSPDGSRIAFVGIRSASAQPAPTPPVDPVATPGVEPGAPVEGALPTPTVAPFIAPVPVFGTEQIYVCDRDGHQLKPLTTRDGLIYFNPSWAPDGHALSALACKPEEWDARRAEDKTAAGRPRLIDLEGRERLLSDRLADAAPSWSPDSTKIAVAFETDVSIFDAAGEGATGANIPLREPLLKASARYDEERLAKKSDGQAPGAVEGGGAADAAPLSFNPIVRLEWAQPETLYLRTAFVRLYKGGELVTNYARWHALHLSPQAVVLGG